VIAYSPPPPLGDLQVVSEPNSLKKSLIVWREDVKGGDEGEVPQQQFDEDDNPIVVEEGSKSGTSKPPTLKDLMKKLEKLKAENKKLKAKGKKGKTYSSSEDGDSSFKEELRKSPIKGGKEETSTISLPITLCLSITITCLTLPLTHPYPLARLPVLMGRTITNGSIA
jgi:hypothetical protein